MSDRYNPTRNLQEAAGDIRERLKPIVEEITTDDEIKDFYRLREINRQIPADKTNYLDRFVQTHLADYRAAIGNIKIFVIREGGKIIAGGQLEIEGEKDQKRGYLGMKFVNSEQRGQGLASELVKKRLDVAKEAGCRLVYALVHKDNFVAMRSIFKDGFDVLSAEKQPGMEHLTDSYYAYRDLITNEKPSSVELDRVRNAIGKAGIVGNELLLPFDDKTAVQAALEAEFIGKFAFEANELPGIEKKINIFRKKLEFMYQNYKQQFESELAEIRDSGMWKDVGVLEGKQGTEVNMGGKTLLNFCSNNYLGLASSDDLAKAAKEGIEKYGFGEASVRFIVGTSAIHKDLEKEICKFFGTEDSITYTSCFDANTGLFETILKEGDAVFSDELNHASIIDGIRLCKAERFRYKNSDMKDLEAQLQEASSRPEKPANPPAGGPSVDTKYRPRRMLIATDGVFSMDGITAKVKEICDLAEKYGALVMVDDSHASGVLGAKGRGSTEGLMDRVDILTSTFGKALGGAGGGFTAGRKEIIEVLHQRSRTTLFSNSLPPAIANAALYVLQNFDSKFEGNRKQLVENTNYFRSAMEKLGFALGGDACLPAGRVRHPITPVMLMDEKLAQEMAKALFAKGIYVRGFTYPVVPKGKARIRVQISAAHTKDQMDKAVKAFEEVGKEMFIIK